MSIAISKRYFGEKSFCLLSLPLVIGGDKTHLRDLSSYFQEIGLKSLAIGLKSIFIERVHRLAPDSSPMSSLRKNYSIGSQKVLGLSLLLLFIFMVSTAWAGTLNRFEMMDGTVIQGKILSFSKGVYRINTELLGNISLPEEKIRAIKPAHSSKSGAKNSNQPKGSTPDAQKIDQIQDQLLSDPETVRLIEELQKNPSVQNILQDEELMKAISQGNLSRVGEDPKIKALMNDKTVGKIIEKNQ